GAYRGRSLDIQRFMRRYGRNVKFYTSIHVGLSGDPGDRLEITPKNWLSGLRKVFESKGSQLQAVQMNDEIFDKRLAVESTSEHFARNVLASSGLRQALLELRSQAPDMKLAVQADALYYHEQSTIRDGEYLAALLGVLHEFADYAERYSIRS
ncbi:MAG: hypothetical protein JXA78_16020, partial [Anaerolineales bacterium]|nr:hypothetical protein [Anaerolineales bacterium]